MIYETNEQANKQKQQQSLRMQPVALRIENAVLRLVCACKETSGPIQPSGKLNAILQLRMFNLRLLATTCGQSVWPGLMAFLRGVFLAACDHIFVLFLYRFFFFEVVECSGNLICLLHFLSLELNRCSNAWDCATSKTRTVPTTSFINYTLP